LKNGVLYWMLRIACWGIYLGHGAFGLMGGKVAWLPYFRYVGIPDELAWYLMPLVGIVDVSSAFIILVLPRKSQFIRKWVLVYMIVWGFWTALLRPLVGEGWSECLERFPNWIVPLGFFAMEFYGDAGFFLRWCLRLGTAIHFIGHGGYGAFVHKAVWVKYFGFLGISADTVQAADLVTRFGWVEIIFGVLVLALPLRPLLAIGFALMAFDPVARPFVGEPIWELVERFGNMSAPLALLVLLSLRQRPAVAQAT